MSGLVVLSSYLVFRCIPLAPGKTLGALSLLPLPLPLLRLSLLLLGPGTTTGGLHLAPVELGDVHVGMVGEHLHPALLDAVAADDRLAVVASLVDRAEQGADVAQAAGSGVGRQRVPGRMGLAFGKRHRFRLRLRSPRAEHLGALEGDPKLIGILERRGRGILSLASGLSFRYIMLVCSGVVMK